MGKVGWGGTCAKLGKGYRTLTPAITLTLLTSAHRSIKDMQYQALDHKEEGMVGRGKDEDGGEVVGAAVRMNLMDVPATTSFSGSGR